MQDGTSKRVEAPEESHVIRLIHAKTEPVPVSFDIGACGIVRRTGLRPTASRVCARAA